MYAEEEGRVVGVREAGQVVVIWMVVGSWIFVPIVWCAGEEVRRVRRSGMVGVEVVEDLRVVIVMKGIVADAELSSLRRVGRA